MYKENRKKIRSMEIGLLVMAAFALLSSCRGKTEAVLETVETAEAETMRKKLPDRRRLWDRQKFPDRRKPLDRPGRKQIPM